MNQMFNLKDKVALITGGRRGIGKAFALALAKEGVKIVVVGKESNTNQLEEEIELIQNFLYISADLRNRNARKNIIKKVVDKFGKIDILINNAGYQHLEAAKDYSLKQFDMDVELMLTTILDLSQQAYPYMKKNGKGKIINIASISSFQGARNIIGYSTVKHALIGMTKCMSNEWAIDNINVNAIAPGIIETDMSKDVFLDEEKSSIIKSRIPSGKFGIVDDLIGSLIFLATDSSNHVNGTVITVDGGWLGR